MAMKTDRILKTLRELGETRRKLLRSLAKAGGWDSVEQMIAEFSSIDVKGLQQVKEPAKPTAAAKAPAKRGRRPAIPGDVREKIRAELKSGKGGPTVAKKYGISIGSVYNIRDE